MSVEQGRQYFCEHEADITKFFTVKAEVFIRNIQMYEQRHNDINKA